MAIYQNGARVLAEGETRREGQILFHTFKMSLVEGKNHFRVTASSGDGSWDSEPVWSKTLRRRLTRIAHQ